jgi:DNA-binding NarL/FixJ family response regulator
MLRIVVADDHHIVRQGICALLEKSGKVKVVGEASNGVEAVSLVTELNPDLVVMDISMPMMDGIQATEQITALALGTKVIILSMHSKPNIVQKVLRKGAGGYLLKNAIGEELMLAVQAASQNEIYLSPSISGALLEDLWGLQKKMGDNMTTDLLTSREQQVLQLIAEGYTNNEIADKLVVSVKTVEKHRANLMGKLGIHDVAGLMREAIKHDLIFVDPL